MSAAWHAFQWVAVVVLVLQAVLFAVVVVAEIRTAPVLDPDELPGRDYLVAELDHCHRQRGAVIEALREWREVGAEQTVRRVAKAVGYYLAGPEGTRNPW